MAEEWNVGGGGTQLMFGVLIISIYVTTVVCGKMFGKMCGKIETLLDWNKNWCGSKY